MSLNNLFLVTVMASLVLTTVSAQVEPCPNIPTGLINISSLEWNTGNENIRVSIGNRYQSEYLQTKLLWDVFSGEVHAIANERIVQVLSLVNKLDIGGRFFTEYDASHLSLSTVNESDYALYVVGDPKTVFSVNVESLETLELGHLPDNLSDLSVLWYDKDKAIIVVEPIYDTGYWVYDVCVDGSCFLDITEILGYLPERPILNGGYNRLAMAGSSSITIFDLENQSIYQVLPISFHLLQNINPIWSDDEQSIYFWGFDDSLTDLVVYELDLSTGDIEVTVTVDYADSINQWMIIPDKHILIWTDVDLHIQCYG